MARTSPRTKSARTTQPHPRPTGAPPAPAAPARSMILDPDAPPVGLLTPEGAPIPLQGVRIAGRLQGSAAHLTVLQRYRNNEAQPIEAVYLFPLPSEAAVTGVEIRAGDRTLRAEIDEREKAFERYDDALRAGHGAVLLDQERPNIFQVSVGSVLPGQTVLVEIRLALLADTWERGVRLMIPSTISPRYVPPTLPPDVLREIERTTPPYALAVPYGLSVEIEAEMGSAVRAVESPSHPVRAEIDGPRARVTLARGEEAPDRDFVLAIETAEPHRAAAVAARRNGREHLLVELRPDLPVPADASREVWFLVDCSGSMDGDSIDQARRAVELCLRALRPGDRFQVVRFGSRHELLFDAPRPYTQEALDEAVARTRTMQADLGGTEILAPLQEIARAAAGGHVDLIVLTDGEVGNEEQVLDFVKRHRDRMRVFSFGIGAGSSEFLVRGLARESGGEAEFIHPGERIEPKVLRQFGRIASTVLADLSLDWGGLAVEQAPAALPPVFAGGAFRVLARLREGAAVPAGATVRLRGTTAGGPVEWAATVSAAGESGAIPQLWARERIRDLEAGFGVPAGSRQRRGAEPGTRALVALSKEYGVLCSETSFVAVEERAEADRAAGELQLRRVPAMVTAGWHGRGSVRRGTVGRVVRCMSEPAARAPHFCREVVVRRSAGMDFSVLDSDLDSPDLDIPTFLRRHEVVARQSTEPPWHLALLMEQHADGSFRLTPELLHAARLTPEKAEALMEKSGLNEATFATALAIAVLHKRAGDERQTWGPASHKAEAWLDARALRVDGEHPVIWLLALIDEKTS